MKLTNLSMKAEYLLEILHTNQRITTKLRAYIRLCEIALYYNEKEPKFSLILTQKLISWFHRQPAAHRIYFSNYKSSLVTGISFP
jgi:hypothetical protein